jgi:epoxyqueuosine reductase
MDKTLPDRQPDARPPEALGQERLAALVEQIREWGRALGFGAIGVADVDLGEAEARLIEWLERGFHGEMDYMARHGRTRARPAELVPGTLRVIVARCDYLPASAGDWVSEGWTTLASPERAYVARYAHGRDYHKVLRARLQTLATRVAGALGPFGYRVFTDSAPVMEVELARKAGVGWRGKHTLSLARDAGSTFFLGEIFVDVPLPVSEPSAEHCGSCERCIDICPTRAIVAPYVLDARRCIAYLTIELKGSIPVDLRALIGNRIYGCDDCQLVCPWNKYAQRADLDDFAARGHAAIGLIEAFSWEAHQFLEKTAGTALRRIGHEQWLRNVAVAIGNALRELGDAETRSSQGSAATASQSTLRDALRAALQARADHPSELVREHVNWAIGQDGV